MSYYIFVFLEYGIRVDRVFLFLVLFYGIIIKLVGVELKFEIGVRSKRNNINKIWNEII